MAPKASGITADVAFDSAEDAQWAIDAHNGVTKIRGRTLTLKLTAKDPCSVVVGNLPADIDGDELSVLFAEQDAGDEEVEVEQDAGDEDVEVEEPPKKKAKGGKASGKKTSAAAADSSEDDAAGQPDTGDKTFEVRYADPALAAKAAKKLNESWWDDTTQARVRLDESGEKIFVRVAAAGVTWQDVKTFCASIGTVVFTGEKGAGKGKGVGKAKGKTKANKGGKPLPDADDDDSSGDEGAKGKGKGKSQIKTFIVKFTEAKHGTKAIRKLHQAWWDDSHQAKVTQSKCPDHFEDWEHRIDVCIPSPEVTWFAVKAWCEQIGPVLFVKEKGKGFAKGDAKGKGKWSGKAWTGEYEGFEKGDSKGNGKWSGKGSTGATKYEVRYESAKHASRCVKKLNGAWWSDDTQAWVEATSEDKCIIYLDDPTIRWEDVKEWAATMGPVSFCGPKGKGKSEW